MPSLQTILTDEEGMVIAPGGPGFSAFQPRSEMARRHDDAFLIVVQSVTGPAAFTKRAQTWRE